MDRLLRIELAVYVALALAVAALVLSLTGGGDSVTYVTNQPSDGSGSAAASSFVPTGAEEVQIIEFKYEPEPVHVKAGAPVAWTNLDLAAHTVTGVKDKGGNWGSAMLQQDDIFVYTFDSPGVYSYICELHPPAPSASSKGGGGRPMQGTVIVE